MPRRVALGYELIVAQPKADLLWQFFDGKLLQELYYAGFVFGQVRNGGLDLFPQWDGDRISLALFSSW
jgi:hypothetical protein